MRKRIRTADFDKGADLKRSRSTLSQIAISAGIVAALIPRPAHTQTQSSIAGVVVRIGTGFEKDGGSVYGLGVELEAIPSSALVPSIRIDHWDFGIICGDFSRCPKSVTTYEIGARYRNPNSTRVEPYVGVHAGYMAWTSDAKGLSMRGRAGVDLRLFKPFGLNADASYVRYWQMGSSVEGMYQDGLLGFNLGARLWW